MSSERYDALLRLLALPDPPDLPKRGFRYVQPGDHARKETLKRHAEQAWLRARLADYGTESAVIGAVRRSPRHLVRKHA